MQVDEGVDVEDLILKVYYQKMANGSNFLVDIKVQVEVHDFIVTVVVKNVEKILVVNTLLNQEEVIIENDFIDDIEIVFKNRLLVLHVYSLIVVD